MIYLNYRVKLDLTILIIDYKAFESLELIVALNIIELNFCLIRRFLN